MSKRARLHVVVLRRLSPTRRRVLLSEIREVAARCFEAPPGYQILSGDPRAIRCAVVALARSHDGALLGFTSALRLDHADVGRVLHLGLTCVDPTARGLGLTHRLLSALVTREVLLGGGWRGLWFSNLASVLSSLGNVARHFDDVYPSPFREAGPSHGHLEVARWLSDRHRGLVHVCPRVPFDPERFVFVGGNEGTPFAHARSETRLHHRDPVLTGWYGAWADLDRGDAVLQVGRIRLDGLIRYGIRGVAGRVPGLRRWAKRPRARRPALPLGSRVGA